MKRKPKLPGMLLWLFAAGLCCALLFWQHTAAVSLLCRLTVHEAQALFPLPLTLYEAETTAPRETEPTSEPPAAETTTAPPATTRTAAAKNDLTATPDDIRKLTAQAKKTADTGKKAGAIRRQTYKNEGVTDKAGVVRIKNVNKTQIDAAKLLKEKADLTVRKDAPCVLIFHTHTTESYQYLDRDYYTAGFPTRDNDKGKNMVRIGDEICAQLEAMGFSVLHDTEIHDARYTGAYARSRETVQAYQKKYPSLQVLLDIHRDAIQLSNGTKIKPVATIDGKQAAQVMIITGCQENGNGVTDFPDWEQNLVFALQLQEKMESTFPGLTRPVFFSPRRYNMHLSHCSLLLEVGSDANTLEEAAYSGRLIGRALGLLLQDYQEEDT